MKRVIAWSCAKCEAEIQPLFLHCYDGCKPALFKNVGYCHIIMETAIYDLLIGGTRRGRVFLSVQLNFKLRIEIVLPDDEPMPIEAQNPPDLVAQFQAVVKEKFGDEPVALIATEAAEIKECQQLFHDGRHALENLFSRD